MDRPGLSDEELAQICERLDYKHGHPKELMPEHLGDAMLEAAAAATRKALWYTKEWLELNATRQISERWSEDHATIMQDMPARETS